MKAGYCTGKEAGKPDSYPARKTGNQDCTAESLQD
jgi:hypothetical protein